MRLQIRMRMPIIRSMHEPSSLRLGVNIDHVATLRNARGGTHPDPVRAALLARDAGADGITAHLREDRRHIRDADIARLMKEVDLPLNLEMAATEEMIAIALRTKPHAVCIVPEKRQERTTEGGLDVKASIGKLRDTVTQLKGAGIRVSLFIKSRGAGRGSGGRNGRGGGGAAYRALLRRSREACRQGA